MRTLIIAPSFLAVFMVAIFSLGWLITEGVESAAIKNGANPPPWAYTGWAQNYASGPATRKSYNAAIDDQIEEMSVN